MQLVYWGKATVIYPVCSSNQYIVSPNASITYNSILAEAFAERFPGGHSLQEYLQLFSLPNSISQSLPNVSRKDEYQQMARVVTWCLQHFLLVQLHLYVTLTFDNDEEVNLPDPLIDNKKHENEDREDKRKKQELVNALSNGYGANEQQVPFNAETFTWPPLMTVRETHGCCGDAIWDKELSEDGVHQQMKEMFSVTQIAALSRIPASKNLSDLSMFLRIAPYFNGKYHLEEIMYHENVNRANLLQLLDKFRDVLSKYEHQDPNLAMYPPKSK